MASAAPGCGVSWNLLAGIGRIESMHANGGATDARGTAVRPIFGPSLDGTLPGNEVIVQSRSADARDLCARARADAVPARDMVALRRRRRRRRQGRRAERLRRLPGRGPVPVHRRTEPAQPERCAQRDPALQQLDGLCPQRAGAGPRPTPPASCPSTCRRSPATSPPSVTATSTGPKGSGPACRSTPPACPPTTRSPCCRLGQRTDVASQINTNVPGFVPGQSLGPLPGPAPAPQSVPQPVAPPPPAWLPPWAQKPAQQQPECAVFCIKDTPAAPPPAAPGFPPPAGPLVQPPAPVAGPVAAGPPLAAPTRAAGCHPRRVCRPPSVPRPGRWPDSGPATFRRDHGAAYTRG